MKHHHDARQTGHKPFAFVLLRPFRPSCILRSTWIRQSRSDSTCYPLDVVDLLDEMDKKINPLVGEVHWVHNVHLVHGLVERAAFNCRF